MNETTRTYEHMVIFSVYLLAFSLSGEHQGVPGALPAHQVKVRHPLHGFRGSASNFRVAVATSE